MRHPYFDLPTPIVFGHRGASGEAPENTLPSFARALEQGAVILETDVHVTLDGVVVLSHDPDLDRTSDATGSIAATEWDRLREFDAGYQFSPDGGRSFPYRGKGIRFPRLDEVLEAFPGIRFNIEIKRNDPALIEGTLEQIRRAGREDLTLLAAAEDETMSALRGALDKHGMRTAMGAAVGDVAGFVRAHLAGTPPPPGAMALQIPPDFGGRPLVTRELLEFAHAHEVQIHVWTINDPAEMERLLDLGVDGVMSDFPARLQEVVTRRRGSP